MCDVGKISKDFVMEPRILKVDQGMQWLQCCLRVSSCLLGCVYIMCVCHFRSLWDKENSENVFFPTCCISNVEQMHQTLLKCSIALLQRATFRSHLHIYIYIYIYIYKYIYIYTYNRNIHWRSLVNDFNYCELHCLQSESH